MKPLRPYLILKFAQARFSQRGKATPDAVPAHILWTEIATRIATKPLHYRSGDEETAAESVHSLFPEARKLVEEHPDAKEFSRIALKMLNETLRPYTARWHGWITESSGDQGKPKLRFRDEVTRRMFRAELRELQPRLIGYEKAFKALSEGSEVKDEWLEPDKAATDALLADWQKTAKTARLGKQSLKAGIGSQVPVYRPQKDCASALEINRKEHEFITRRRRILDQQNQSRHQDKCEGEAEVVDAVGLALAGGGIRSATVCLGAVQVLARYKLLTQIDYLSTVSGGGYFGSFLSSILGTEQDGKAPDTEEAVAELVKKTFDPEPDGAEAAAVRHLRDNSKYLLSGGLWGKLKIAGLMVSGLITNLLMILPVPLIAALTILLLNSWGIWGKPSSQGLPFPSHGSPVTWFLIGAFGFLVLFWILLAPIQKVASGEKPDSFFGGVRSFWTVVTLGCALFIVAILALFALPAVFHWYGNLKHWLNHLNGPMSQIFSENTIAALLAALPLLLGAAARFVKRPWVRSLLSQSFILSGPVFYAWVILFVGAKLGLATGIPEWDWRVVSCVTLAWVLWSFFFININTLGPHGYYRDRLCECYLAYRGRNESTAWSQAIRTFWGGRGKEQENNPKENNPKIAARLRLPLSKMTTPGAAPYHLVNCVVNLPASANPNLRGRNGDFFIISPFFCGSPICGYAPTDRVEEADRHLDLGTAMAISGAAASTNMGWRTLPNYRFLMALFNVRLGYWLPNPGRPLPAPKQLPLTVPHQRCNFLGKLFGGIRPWYFLAEITGRIQENMKYVNVSDGGHIENLGVYELLRRKCKFIICLDGGADLKTEGSNLQRLERYALIDLGIKFRYNLADLQPNKDGISPAYAVLIKILYQPGECDESDEPDSEEIGWMIYLKPALTGAEPQYVLDYRYRNASFPHEGILDQVFEEEKFEAYRAVGECAAESLFRKEIMGNVFRNKIVRDEKPGTVRDWFQKLADSLLPDNDKAFLSAEK